MPSDEIFLLLKWIVEDNPLCILPGIAEKNYVNPRIAVKYLQILVTKGEPQEGIYFWDQPILSWKITVGPDGGDFNKIFWYGHIF